ncbi:MAG: tetratricopeptide repeat protein [Succinivibrio sp.]|nr:tetratricopeptide repeat protein [Succinivibrio sp.]
MIKYLLLIAFVCLAIALGPWLADSQGFVHVVAGKYVIESSLTTTVVIIVVFFALLLTLLSVLGKFIRLPGGTLRWFHSQSERRAQSQQDQAVLAYEEGDYERSLSLIKQSGSLSELPVRTLLLGAKSAFNLGKYDFTRELLGEAEGRDRKVLPAISILRAKLNLRIDNTKAALENLEKVKDSFKNRLIYQLYYQCYKKNFDIDKIYAASEQLLKHKLISEEDMVNIYTQYFEHRLKQAENRKDMDAFMREMPKDKRQSARYMGPFVNKLLMLGETDEARSIALNILRKDFDPDFLESISTWEVDVPEIRELLKKQQEENSIASQVNLPLLKALGNLQLRAGLLQDALENYRKALELSKSEDIYTKIGLILSNQQKYSDAAGYFTRAAGMREHARALSYQIPRD